MKNIKYSIIALALLAVSCQKSDEGSTTESSEAVAFTASSDLATRSEFTESWSVGDRVGLFDMYSGKSNYEYTVSSVTSGLAELSPAGPLVITYPNTGDLVVAFAYYPYSTRFDGDGFDAIDLSYQEDLLVSGIYPVSKEEVDVAADPVNLAFTHALSHLSLTLEFEDEFLKDSGFASADDIEEGNVEIYIGGFSMGKYQPKESEDDIEDDPVVDPVVDTEDDLDYGEFAMTYANNPEDHDDLYFESVDGSDPLSFESFILPLDYADLSEEDLEDEYKEVYEAVVYFKFTSDVEDNGHPYVKIYNKPLSEILSEAGGEALAGYKYSYKVTVGSEELTFSPITSSNITGWEDVTVTTSN